MSHFPKRAEVDAAIPSSRLPYIEAQEALRTRDHRSSRLLSNERIAVHDEYVPRVIARALRGLLAPDLQPPLNGPLKELVGAMVKEFDKPHLKGFSDERVLANSGNLEAAVRALGAAVDHGTQYSEAGYQQPTYHFDTVGGPFVPSQVAKGVLEEQAFAHVEEAFSDVGGQNG